MRSTALIRQVWTIKLNYSEKSRFNLPDSSGFRYKIGIYPNKYGREQLLNE